MTTYLATLKKKLDELEESESDINNTQEEHQLKHDIEKLKGLWKSVKENKESLNHLAKDEDYTSHIRFDRPSTTDPRLSYDKRQNQQHHNRESINISTETGYGNGTKILGNNPNDAEMNNLREKLRLSEGKLAKLQKINNELHNKLAKAEEELKECYSKIAKQTYENKIKNNEIDDLSQKVYSVSVNNQTEIEKLKEHYENTRLILVDKEYKINKLEEALREKEQKLFELSTAKPDYLEKEFENIMIENRLLREKINSTEKSLDNLYLVRKNESAVLLELERLQADVARLLKLLQSTEEYQEFCTQNENTNLNSVRFLKGIFNSKTKTKSKKICNEQAKKDAEREKLFWVPIDAFKFAHDFKLKYEGKLTDELIEMLLFELNKIWNMKQEKAIQKVKETYQKEISDLKRHYSQMDKHEDIYARKALSRLRDQLKRSSSKSSSARKKTELDILNESLKNTTESFNRMHTLQEENKKLVGKIKQLEKNTQEDKNSSNNNKLYFAEGAFWLYETMERELNRLRENFKEIISEFENKLQEIDQEFNYDEIMSMIMKRNDWFVESINNVLITLTEKFVGYKNKIKSLLDDQ